MNPHIGNYSTMEKVFNKKLGFLNRLDKSQAFLNNFSGEVRYHCNYLQKDQTQKTF